jgi:hypothetical protein
MTKRIEYQAGIASAWAVNDDEHIVYDCGVKQSGRIAKATITAVGVTLPEYVTMVDGVSAVHKALGTKGKLGGLLIAYVIDGGAPQLATITLDFGDDACLVWLKELSAELSDRYVGEGPRGVLMSRMGVSKMRENLIIVALLLLVVGFAMLMTWLDI